MRATQSSIPLGGDQLNDRRPMTLCEKILAHHALGFERGCPIHVVPGDIICVSVDWILSSEISWLSIDKRYSSIGRPQIHRKDRLWLAADHVVDPRINHLPKNRNLIEVSERAAKELGLGENYQPPNTTIMHTEYYRERVQPGMLVIGADSHTCSAGGLGSLAIGMGVTDTTIPLVTGETYIQVPETLRINLINEPPFGVGGKDVILGILGQLKRNTVAQGRVVEYGGDGLRFLSCDARFAIANMTTEFGGITGIFVPDAITSNYIENRKDPIHKSDCLYFRPDIDAQYAETYDIDLSKLDNFVALYPSPDNVKPVRELAQDGLELDGCFIGACTTAEEDLILAALVLEKGLEKGLVPSSKGKRRVTPGSLPIVAKLRRLGLLEFYEKAGFEVGAPGCSYCVGMGADQAGEGEVWLSSQNRNFRDRMGKGSFANITSAATVASSSFSMKVSDPRELLDQVDRAYFERLCGHWEHKEEESAPIYISPNPVLMDVESKNGNNVSDELEDANSVPSESIVQKIIRGKVQRFGDSIDTDSIIPTDKCGLADQSDLGRGAFCYYRPDFYDKAQAGANIIVAGEAFGSGSSREQAPTALQGAGIQAVIAKSFAFIYGRNQVNNGLLGIRLKDNEFYDLVDEGTEIEIDLPARMISIGEKKFTFRLGAIEERVLEGGGLLEVYRKFGSTLFRRMQRSARKEMARRKLSLDHGRAITSLDW